MAIDAEIASHHITTHDGTAIAVDLYLPHEPSDALASVMIMTRYWRSFAVRGRPGEPMSQRDPLIADLVGAGFAVVVVDARGTGASEGQWPHPWSQHELDDYGQIVDWIVAQPWSNGCVGATGTSYEGTTAMLLAASGRQAVRAVAPRSVEYRILEDIIAPGAIPNTGFLRAWSTFCADLDANRTPSMFGLMAKLFVTGVRPVDEDRDGRKLAATIAERNNPEVFAALEGRSRGDERWGDQAIRIDAIGINRHIDALRDEAVPTQIWGSWMDGTTARAALEIFEALDHSCEAWIGAWSHTGEEHGSLGASSTPASPPIEEQRQATIAFLREHLAPDATVPPRRVVHYYTMGAELWRQCEAWPPAGIATEPWYLGAGGLLTPRSRAAGGETVRYQGDRRSTTGSHNRWMTQMAKPVRYRHRERAARHLCLWRSAELEADLEITGSPRLVLDIESTDEGPLCAYLEVVDERSRVHYLSEGLARLDAGRREIEVEILPTSVVLPAGWRIQLGLACADAGTFPLPSSAPTWLCHLSTSRLELPVGRPRG